MPKIAKQFIALSAAAVVPWCGSGYWIAQAAAQAVSPVEGNAAVDASLIGRGGVGLNGNMLPAVGGSIVGAGAVLLGIGGMRLAPGDVPAFEGGTGVVVPMAAKAGAAGVVVPGAEKSMPTRPESDAKEPEVSRSAGASEEDLRSVSHEGASRKALRPAAYETAVRLEQDPSVAAIKKEGANGDARVLSRAVYHLMDHGAWIPETELEESIGVSRGWGLPLPVGARLRMAGQPAEKTSSSFYPTLMEVLGRRQMLRRDEDGSLHAISRAPASESGMDEYVLHLTLYPADKPEKTVQVTVDPDSARVIRGMDSSDGSPRLMGTPEATEFAVQEFSGWIEHDRLLTNLLHGERAAGKFVRMVTGSRKSNVENSRRDGLFSSRMEPRKRAGNWLQGILVRLVDREAALLQAAKRQGTERAAERRVRNSAPDPSFDYYGAREHIGAGKTAEDAAVRTEFRPKNLDGVYRLLGVSVVAEVLFAAAGLASLASAGMFGVGYGLFKIFFGATVAAVLVAFPSLLITHEQNVSFVMGPAGNVSPEHRKIFLAALKRPRNVRTLEALMKSKGLEPSRARIWVTGSMFSPQEPADAQGLPSYSNTIVDYALRLVQAGGPVEYARASVDSLDGVLTIKDFGAQ